MLFRSPGGCGGDAGSAGAVSTFVSAGGSVGSAVTGSTVGSGVATAVAVVSFGLSSVAVLFGLRGMLMVLLDGGPNDVGLPVQWRQRAVVPNHIIGPIHLLLNRPLRPNAGARLLFGQSFCSQPRELRLFAARDDRDTFKFALCSHFIQ